MQQTVYSPENDALQTATTGHTPKRRQGFFKFQTGKSSLQKELEGSRELSIQTYASLIRSCTNTRNLEDGRRVHEHIESSRHRKERFLGNLLVEMYGKCGRVAEAREVFDRIMNPNVFSWNMMIAAYAPNGHTTQARSLFDKMPDRDVVSWCSMIAAYTFNGNVVQARELFDRMQQPTVVPWNAMVAAYAHNGYHSEALDLFGRMDLEGVKPNEITFVSVLDACSNLKALEVGRDIHTFIIGSEEMEADVVLGTALVNFYGKCSELLVAKEVFDNMKVKNVVSWTAMLAAYAEYGDLLESRRLFSQMPVKNVVSWNAIITAHSQNGELHEAIRMFMRMDLEGMNPDAVSFICVLDACAGAQAALEGKLIHESLISIGFDQSDMRIATALIHFYGRCGFVERAKQIFEAMKHRNEVSWNSMVAVFAHNGRGSEAVGIFREMSLEGFAPDEATFVAILSACSHAGLLELGLLFFICATGDFGFVPTRDHYVCVVDLLGRAAWLDEAEELLKSMPFKPHSVPWMALLSSCKAQSDVNRALRAAGNASELDPENASPYLLLNSMFEEKNSRSQSYRSNST